MQMQELSRPLAHDEEEVNSNCKGKDLFCVVETPDIHGCAKGQSRNSLEIFIWPQV